MELVVDSNVLFTFFWKNSAFRDIVAKTELTFFSPERALVEIKKHSPDLINKTNLSPSEFNDYLRKLTNIVKFVQLKDYDNSLIDVEKLAKYFSKNEKDDFLDDSDFLALSLHLDIPLWSNDKLLKKQPEVVTFSTEELIELLA